jgi:CxxC motif-containing protein
MVYGKGQVERNVSVSNCTVNVFNNETKKFDTRIISIYGRHVPRTASYLIKRIVGDVEFVVTDVDIETHHYKMSLNYYVKHAERTN